MSHVAKCLNDPLCPRATKGSFYAFGVSGAEDLRPPLQSWLKPVAHRAPKELHLHPASFRFDIVLLAPSDSHHSVTHSFTLYSLAFCFFSLQRPPRSHPWHSIVPESEKYSTGGMQVVLYHNANQTSLKLGKHTQIKLLFTCRKWPGYFLLIQFSPKVAFPHSTWSPQLWVSNSNNR